MEEAKGRREPKSETKALGGQGQVGGTEEEAVPEEGGPAFAEEAADRTELGRSDNGETKHR